MITYVDAPVKRLPREDWAILKVNSFVQYLISTRGRIYSPWAARIIKGTRCDGQHMLDYSLTMDKDPLPIVDRPRHLKNNRTKQTFQRLVAITFLPRPKNCNMVIHLDFNKDNNSVENLKWVKKSDSWMLHARNSPGWYSSKKLTKADVEKIREIMNVEIDRPSVKSVAADYGVSEMTIFRTLNGDCWKKAGGNIRSKQPPNKLRPVIVKKIKQYLKAGASGVSISMDFNISTTQVSRIKNNISYRNSQ